MLAALSPARRRLVLLLLAGMAAVALVATVLLVQWADSRAVRPVAQDRPGPVLLVPGYGGSTSSLDVLAKALRSGGRDATTLAPVGDGTADLTVQAAALGAAVEEALARTGAGSVDVVGYSAGGVVARLWVRDFGGGNLARRVVTLGSPQHGTGLAELAAGTVPGRCPTACQQLTPDSDLLRALNAGDETPDGPAFISIWTTFDDVVTPPDSARLEGALNITVQSVCPGSRVPHGSLPSDPVVVTLVMLQLGADPPVAPSPQDCRRLSS